MGRAGADSWQFPFLCSTQTQHSWHDGLITSTCSFSLTCPPGLCSSSSCMGMKCFSCYTNIQHCKTSLEFLPFPPHPSILVPLSFQGSCEFSQRHSAATCGLLLLLFSAFSQSKTFFFFQCWLSKGIGFGSSMKMSSQHKTWASFWSK